MVEAYGTMEQLVEIAQQVAWISSALQRGSNDNGTPQYCITILKPERSRPPNEVRNKAGHVFSVSYSFEPITTPTCWLKAVGASTILAAFFPVPVREKTRGLEASIDVLADLIGARHATEFKRGVVIKGPHAMLVPVGIHKDVVQWHIVYSQDPDERMTYEHGVSECPQRMLTDNVVLDTLQTTTAVVGWCTHAETTLGSPESNYKNITYSGAKKTEELPEFPRSSVRMTRISSLEREDYIILRCTKKTFLNPPGSFRKLLLRAARTKVLLYDLKAQCAWLVHGDEAILHIIRTKGSFNAFSFNGKEVHLESESTAGKTLETNQELFL